MQEVWKSLKGIVECGDNYEVSTFGNVRNSKKNKIMKTDITTRGYHRLMISHKGKTKKYFVHKLVALAFIPNPENKPEVNHIDAVKGNNRVDNLEWNTRKENVAHASKNGLYKTFLGESHGLTRLTEQDVIEIKRLLSQKVLQSELVERYGVSQTTISNIKRGVSWGHVV